MGLQSFDAGFEPGEFRAGILLLRLQMLHLLTRLDKLRFQFIPALRKIVPTARFLCQPFRQPANPPLKVAARGAQFTDLHFQQCLFGEQVFLLLPIFPPRFLQRRPQLCLGLPILVKFALEFVALSCDGGSLLRSRFVGLLFLGDLFC